MEWQRFVAPKRSIVGRHSVVTGGQLNQGSRTDLRKRTGGSARLGVISVA